MKVDTILKSYFIREIHYPTAQMVLRK